jgi:hypothetical protein
MTTDPLIRNGVRHELERDERIRSKSADEIRAIAAGFEKQAHSLACTAARMEVEAEEMEPHVPQDERAEFIQDAEREVAELRRQASRLVLKAEIAFEMLAEQDRKAAVRKLIDELKRRAEG